MNNGVRRRPALQAFRSIAGILCLATSVALAVFLWDVLTLGVPLIIVRCFAGAICGAAAFLLGGIGNLYLRACSVVLCACGVLGCITLDDKAALRTAARLYWGRVRHRSELAPERLHDLKDSGTRFAPPWVWKDPGVFVVAKADHSLVGVTLIGHWEGGINDAAHERGIPPIGRPFIVLDELGGGWYIVQSTSK